MALNARTKEFTGSSNRVEQPALEAGTYPARLVQVIDLGVQTQRAWKNEEAKPPVQELMVTYELVDEFIVDEDGNFVEDKPRWVSETFPFYNLESDLAKSTKRYYALDPKKEKDGDWTQLIGTPVMVTITQDAGTGKNAGKVFNNIASTSSMRQKEADKLPELKNAGKIFDQGDTSTIDIMLTLPQWLQDKIKGGLEWDGSPMALALSKAGTGGSEKASEKKEVKKKAKPVVEEDEEVEVEGSTDIDEDSGEDW